MLQMLKHAENGVGLKGLDVDSVVIEHIQVNRQVLSLIGALNFPEIPPRRAVVLPEHIIYRSSHTCQVKMVLTEKEQTVPKPRRVRGRRQVTLPASVEGELLLGAAGTRGVPSPYPPHHLHALAFPATSGMLVCWATQDPGSLCAQPRLPPSTSRVLLPVSLRFCRRSVPHQRA